MPAPFNRKWRCFPSLPSPFTPVIWNPELHPRTSGIFELQNLGLPPSEMYRTNFTVPVTLRIDIARRTLKHESGCRTYPGLHFPTEGRGRTTDVAEETSEGG